VHLPFRLFATNIAAIIIVLLLAVVFIQERSFGGMESVSVPLQVSEIRIYEYERDNIDYRTGKSPATTIQEGTEIAVNGLVINHNHRGEHFDYITEIRDSDGYTEYLHVRAGVAVPIGGQIGIDSETLPVILERAGNYTVKVFTWSNVDGTPIALSDGLSESITVAG
jgi:hypothetical protein